MRQGRIEPRKLALIIGTFTVIVITVIVLAFINKPEDSDRIRITNYDTYVKNIASSERDNLEKALFYTTSLNTPKEKLGQIKDASIREGSYKQRFEDRIYTTTFIVDMESVRQSYKISSLYSNQRVEDSGLIDYTALALCLPKKSLLFEPFQCQDRISIEAGLKESDPILEYLPESTLNYTLERDISSSELKLIATIMLSEVDYRLGEQASIDRYKKQIDEWLIMRGLSSSDYSITYEIQ